ncbi:MAG: hypothetical protein PVI57_18990 [Gemmatimonadota bacterium]|jgi:hypothetical protein
MDDPRFERALRERFARLRGEEEARAPDFETVFGEARRRVEAGGGREPAEVVFARRPRRWYRAAVTLAAAALAAVYLGAPDPEERFEALVASYSDQLAGGRWRTPTDGLLDVPGMDLLVTVPSIEGLRPGMGDVNVPREGGEEG